LSTVGKGFSALGFLPSLLALTLYSMLPILRNGVAGITGVDPAIREAADGVGMTPRQKLLQVELPLAAPVIMAGIRTAAVWTIGAATLSTPVGQTSLGNYIFAGLQTENWVFVLFGCAASAVLALAADQLLGLVETGARLRRRGLVIAGFAGLLAGTAVTLLPLAHFGKPASYVVGAKNFSEQYILAEVIAGRLEREAVDAAYTLGFKAERSFQPTFMYRALASGDVDVISAFSSDGRIAADKLVVLSDPKGAIPPYDAVVLISPKRANDRRLIE